jgi:hypothetical protein
LSLVSVGPLPRHSYMKVFEIAAERAAKAFPDAPMWSRLTDVTYATISALPGKSRL